MQNKPIPEWEIIPHFFQIADTGDYDGHFEINNGEISILTKSDDDEGLDAIIKALNDAKIGLRLNDDKVQYEIAMLKGDLYEAAKDMDYVRTKLGGVYSLNSVVRQAWVKSRAACEYLKKYLLDSK